MRVFLLQAGISLTAAFTAVAGPIIAQVPAQTFDWVGMIEKGGTIAVLIWTVLYFQRRTDDMTSRIEGLAGRALDLVRDSALADRDMSSAIQELAKAIQNLHKT